MQRFYYIWNEWFHNLREIAADPRCAVDKTTFFERLKLWPIEQAVKEVPDWHPDDWVALRIPRRIPCPKEQLRQRLRQGFPPKIAIYNAVWARDLLLYALNIPLEEYFKVHKRVARERERHNCLMTFKAIGTPVAYRTFLSRLEAGWDVKSAALCNFVFLLFGEKYRSRAEIVARYPWVRFYYQRKISLEERIIC